jgi:ribosomal-protein-alanine N-acetyltransferase
MRSVDSLEPPELPFNINGELSLVLRLARVADCHTIVDYYIRNSEHFAATDPPRPEGFLTTAYWKARARASILEFKKDQSVRFFIFDAQSGRVLGSTNYTQVSRGPLQACFLGYGLDQEIQGRGVMTRALETGIRYVFDSRNLHRIMANHLPENERSARVLKRLGFEVEGLAKKYLFIDGQWRDHVLNSLVNPDWRVS